LVSHESVASHDLLSLSGVDQEILGEFGRVVLLLIDTAGCGLQEDDRCEGGSHRNVREAELVVQHVETLITAGVLPSQIGVITPYSGQVLLF
jgi:ATP-dependent RNA/DNA helicase IGHMBP2